MLAVALLLGTVGAAPVARPQIVSVVVTNDDGEPIPNAWVRIPQTEGRRVVDPETGLWEASTVYHYDGSPLVFTRGLRLELTVSAPGYLTRRLAVQVRSRRNLLPVTLQPMPTPQLLTTSEDPDALMAEWLAATASEAP